MERSISILGKGEMNKDTDKVHKLNKNKVHRFNDTEET